MKKTLLTIVLTFIVTVIAVVAYGIHLDNQDVHIEDYRDDFVAVCTENYGGGSAFCDCLLDEISIEYELNEFFDTTTYIRENNRLPEHLYEDQRACMGDYEL